MEPAAISGQSTAICDKRRSEEHTSELQSRQYLVCRLLLEKKQQRSVDLPHHRTLLDRQVDYDVHSPVRIAAAPGLHGHARRVRGCYLGREQLLTEVAPPDR